jgi:hypothetical protein
MSNSLLTNDVISKECLMSLKNNLVFTRNASREYSKEYAVSGAKIGNVFNIRKPSRYTVTSGSTLEIQDTADQSVALTVDKHYHVGMAFTQDDRTLSIDRFRERYIDPAMIALANKIDSQFFFDMYQAVYSAVGVPSASALPSTLKGFLQAKAKMELLGAPRGQTSAIVDPLVQASLVEGLKGLFQSAEKIAEQYEEGVMGIAAGSKFSATANVPKHTIGALGSTPLTDYASPAYVAGTATIKTKGWTAAASNRLKKGDVISIGSVYAVNPQTRVSTGQLAQFVVAADFSSDGSGNGTVTIDRGLYASGQYQNVDSLPADGAAISVFAETLQSYGSIVAPQNMVFLKQAFALGCVDLELPADGAKASRAVDEDAGLSLTMTSQFDIVNYRNITRIDFLGGWKCIYPELACRVVGQPA